MKHRPLLTIDVGNTSTSFAVFNSKLQTPQPRDYWTLSTAEILKKKTFEARVKRSTHRLKINSSNLGVVLSSVVPSLNTRLIKKIKKLTHKSPLSISHNSKSKIKIRYKKPAEVGSDRIVNARGAVSLKKGPLIVVDFGTATTFDCVSARNEYLGGVIAPGPVISAEALYNRTAKLPKVILDKPVRILGQNTLESIQSGLFHGYRGLVKEIVARLKDRMGRQTRVLATGGQAKWILKGMPIIDLYSPYLTHIGLFWLWKDAGRG